MDFNELIEELRDSSKNLDDEAADKNLSSSVYCKQACKVSILYGIQDLAKLKVLQNCDGSVSQHTGTWHYHGHRYQPS